MPAIVGIVVGGLGLLVGLAGEPPVLRFGITILGIVLGVVITMLLTVKSEFEDLGKHVNRLSTGLSVKFKTDYDRSKFIRAPQQEIERDQMAKVWIELLWQLQDSFCATNFIKKEFFFAMPYAEHGLAVQAAKVQVHDKLIKKLLIVKDEEELREIEQILDDQHKVGLRVKYLFRSRIDDVPELAAALSKQGQGLNIDFGIFDSDIVLLWFLDENRNFTGGRILCGEEQVKSYIDFFDALFSGPAEPWPRRGASQALKKRAGPAIRRQACALACLGVAEPSGNASSHRLLSTQSVSSRAYNVNSKCK